MLRRSFVRYIIWVALAGFTLSSCSLLEAINNQDPLSKAELNRRLLVQDFVRLSNDKIEKAADSIIEYSLDPEITAFAYLWKLKALQAYNNSAFQTSPDLALLDTWALTKQFDDFIKSERGQMRYKGWQPLVQSVMTLNLRDLEERAMRILSEERFLDYRNLVYQYAALNPLVNLKFVDQTLRKEYLVYRGLPDSSAVQTVGNLPQVVADWSNRLQFNSESSVKSLKWNTEMMITDKGWDTIDIDSRIEHLDQQVTRLLNTAEQLPSRLEGSIDTVSNRLETLFGEVERNLDESKEFIDSERMALDSMVKREREAFDVMVERERDAVMTDIKTVTDTSLQHIDDILWKVFVILILVVVILITVPFIIGYYLGRAQQKNVVHETSRDQNHTNSTPPSEDP